MRGGGEKEREKKRDKNETSFGLSSASTFHRATHYLRTSSYSTLFFLSRARPPPFRDIGLTPATTTSKPEAENPLAHLSCIPWLSDRASSSIVVVSTHGYLVYSAPRSVRFNFKREQARSLVHNPFARATRVENFPLRIATFSQLTGIFKSKGETSNKFITS